MRTASPRGVAPAADTGRCLCAGQDRDVWAEGADLMMLANQSSSNRFTRWIGASFAPMYHQAAGAAKSCFVCGKCPTENRDRASSLTIYQGKKNNVQGPQEQSGIAEYSDASVTTIAQLVGSVLASLLPILAIVVLHLVDGTGTRLGLIAVFSAIFSSSLWFLNDGKLIEVFSATSA